ncbi:DUF3086 domain-containing protein [Chlorogloea sp. CCALA 695]|uniref:DUF3086 domain-containing protein n=1 Tax=Chlorogloea sp. CCALA 695 TaxID=2107693 RepID=UPI000D05ABAF|nr:DUF3086 domain-containing protein [Chlorogloea sp. CCALA 695]PSB34546.1 DUF3086 domain-containing protein [Chlorogloea sp. CCALA 695]
MNSDQFSNPKPTTKPVTDSENTLDDSDRFAEFNSLDGQTAASEDELLTQIETGISDIEQIESKEQRIADLQVKEQSLKKEIASLQANYSSISEQLSQTQNAMSVVVQESLAHLEQRKQTLVIAIEQLERRQERIRAEMRTTFAGTSQELAIRVQGFKDYLTGSLQDLAASAEQLQLTSTKQPPLAPIPSIEPPPPKKAVAPSIPQFTEQRFQSTTKEIRQMLDEYRTKPDYYGEPWKLRRTFEPIHAERVSQWFFNQGGRGALKTMGSRLQNILISSAVISVLSELHGDRLRALIIANTPERLGEWRRGLQDCLGIVRADFGPDRGVVLFESADALAIKAERLVKAKELPLIIVDDSEEKISLSLLQFPLLLAFAPDPQMVKEREDDFFN